MPSHHNTLWGCTIAACAIVAAGCAPGLEDTKSLGALKSSNEGIVFAQLAYRGLPCKVGNLALATEVSPGRFQLYKTLMMGGITVDATLSPRQISLPAGTYHIGYVACQSVADMGHMMGVGQHDGTLVVGNPLQSLGTFTVAAGEVVNIGQINIDPTDYLAHNATISVSNLSDVAAQRLQAGAPTLSAAAVARPMTVTSPGQAYKIERAQIGNG